MAEVTIDAIVCRWESSDRPLFKGRLISQDGCCCAQGDVLRVSGVPDQELLQMEQGIADRKVADLLGISVTHSVLLRRINDSREGSPQDVLVNPEKILGPHAKLVLAFWKHLDTFDWKARAAARDAAWDAAWDAARAAARDAAGAAAGDAAWAAAGDAAWASNEIQGHEVIKDFCFLPLFGITIEDLKRSTQAALASA